MMKGHYRIIAATMALFSACTSEDDIKPIYTVGEADNVITLRAGVSTGESDVQTRATDSGHTNHLALTQGTKAALRIDGTWTDHTPETVSQLTTATIGSETSSGSKHNSVSMSPVRYWDDYGTADPTNISGRNTGLTIYGVAVDGYKKDGDFALPSETNNNLSSISDWKALSWTLDANQTSGWANYDLLTSNNIQAVEGYDGTLKFDDVKSGNASDLLVFTHAMSKVTVKLKAGAGFSQNKFTATPSVILTSNTGDATTNTEWAYTKGNVDVTTKAVSSQSELKVITMHHTNTTDGQYSAIYDALVMPGSCFGTTDDAIIARINADGNVYYVTAKQIRAKMLELNNTTDYNTKSGKNYIINVIVNKTEIEVSATVTNWVDVESAEVSPVINVDASWGSSDTGSSDSFDSFSFYRSTSFADGYSNGLTGNTKDYFISEAIAKKPNASEETQWKFYNSTANDATEVHLYWPDHNTHYQFRGVWPNTSVESNDTQTAPHVSKVSESDATQKIDIKNAAYSSSQSYPSNLMIGRPEVKGNCNNTETGHTPTDLFSGGICATEGKVNLNFRYVMSQVEVVLSTSGVGSSDRVNIDANTVVEIVNVAKEGYVRLGDREVVPSDDATNSYTLDKVSGEGNDLKRHSAIVPQDLAFTTPGASTNTRFKITVTNSDSSKDVYYADIKPIKKDDGTGFVAPNGKWESGVHYIYNLKLTKSEIKVSATITDWKTVNAAEDVWM